MQCAWPFADLHVLLADVLGAAVPVVVRVVRLVRDQPAQERAEVLEHAALVLVHAHAAGRVGRVDAADPVDDAGLADDLRDLVGDVGDVEAAGRLEVPLRLEDLHRRTSLTESALRSIAGPVAQRLEQRTHNSLVPGSNPGGPVGAKPNPQALRGLRHSWGDRRGGNRPSSRASRPTASDVIPTLGCPMTEIDPGRQAAILASSWRRKARVALTKARRARGSNDEFGQFVCRHYTKMRENYLLLAKTEEKIARSYRREDSRMRECPAASPRVRPHRPLRRSREHSSRRTRVTSVCSSSSRRRPPSDDDPPSAGPSGGTA